MRYMGRKRRHLNILTIVFILGIGMMGFLFSEIAYAAAPNCSVTPVQQGQQWSAGTLNQIQQCIVNEYTTCSVSAYNWTLSDGYLFTTEVQSGRIIRAEHIQILQNAVKNLAGKPGITLSGSGPVSFTHDFTNGGGAGTALSYTDPNDIIAQINRIQCCSGPVPANAASCGNTPNGASYTIVGSCGSAGCTAKCNAGFIQSGNSCVAGGGGNDDCQGQPDGTPCDVVLNCNSCLDTPCVGAAHHRLYYPQYGAKCVGGGCTVTAPFCDWTAASCGDGGWYCGKVLGFDSCPGQNCTTNNDCGPPGYIANEYACGSYCTCVQTCATEGQNCGKDPYTLPCCGGAPCVGFVCQIPTCSGATPCGNPPNCTAIPSGKCNCAGNVNDCAGNCGGLAVVDCAGNCGGLAVVDCAGNCGGNNVIDACGQCGGNGSECGGGRGT